MASVVVSVLGDIVAAFRDNNNLPLIGGMLLTQSGNVNYPTYTEPTGTIQNSNPIILNNRGEIATSSGTSIPLYVQQNVAYTFTLFDASGNQIWSTPAITAPATLASLQSYFTQSVIGSILFPQTAIELAASVTPTNYQYQPYSALRYVSAAQLTDVLAGTLTLDVGPALVVAQSVSEVLSFPAGIYLIGSNTTLSSKFAPQPGAILWVGAGVTLTVNSQLITDAAQICISGPGTIAFGQEASSDGWRPEWFGGKPSQIAPTGTININSASLSVSSALDLEVGAGIAVFGAGAAPATPTGLALVNVSGSGTTYNVQIAAVLPNSGVSAACSVVSIASGATPNITASWSSVTNAVLYLVFVNTNLVGSTYLTTYPIGTAIASGILFSGCPATAPASASNGWFTALIQSISGTSLTLSATAVATATGQTVRLDATQGLQTCLTAADAAYGFGQTVAGTLGARTNSILLNTGIYNITSTLIGKGMFSIIGQGTNWIYGSVILKNQIYANAFTVQGSSNDNVSVGCTFDKWQMAEANVAYTFSAQASNYYMRFLGWNGSATIQSNSVYFLEGMRYDVINAIWMSHGDDWVVKGTCDGASNFFHQQLDTSVPTTTRMTDSLFSVNLYQPQQIGIYLSSANGITFSGCRFNYVAPATGNAASAAIELAPSSGAAVNNISIVSNTFLFTRCCLNAGQTSGVNFSGNSVGGLAGTGILLNNVSAYTIVGNTWNFTPGRTENFIAFNSSSANSQMLISDNVFDMTNTSNQYAITSTNAALNNTVLTNSKVVRNTTIGLASVRTIDWIDMGSDMEVQATYSFLGSYPSTYQIGTFSAAQAYSSAIIDLRWNSSINKTSVSAGEETGYSTIMLAQAGGSSVATTNAIGSPTAVRMEFNNGAVGASPTTTYAVSTSPSSAPSNASGTLNMTVTCSAAGGAMASPTEVSTTLQINTRGLSNAQGTGVFALKVS